MRLYIPEIKDTIELSSDWRFALHYEGRNATLFEALGIEVKDWWKNRSGSTSIILPKGTHLVIDRIYIRNGAEAYSSITFRIAKCPKKEIEKKRFWAKLADVNKIEFEHSEKIVTASLSWQYPIRNYLTVGHPVEKSYIVGPSHITRKAEAIGITQTGERFKINYDVVFRNATKEEITAYMSRYNRVVQILTTAPDLVVPEKITFTLTDLLTNKVLKTAGSWGTVSTYARTILNKEIKS